MLRPRIIPSLLYSNKGLVKTSKFGSPKYVGDPINAVKIFNEKKVDELAFFDIDATVMNQEPDYDLISKLASQSRMPLCYGGGVKTVEHAQRIFSLGIEKIALSSAVISNPNLIYKIGERVGIQSVVVVLDVKKNWLSGYELYTHNGKKSTGRRPSDFLSEICELGVGEVVINSIDNDGMMSGFDTELLDSLIEQTSIPITILGGAGSLEDFEKMITRYGIIGVAAGSFFVFKGPYRAVLINYPSREMKEELFKKSINED